ncbi:MAG TPA: response regulator transcription factor [Thermoanaerobaculia bacterium]|nr:response regulator transcription factor [Thermoanaerobaculia bacterium]
MTAQPAATEKIRVVLADDHPIVLNGLEQLLQLEADFEVAGRCLDGETTLAVVRELKPEVLILDVRMPGKDGLDVLRALRREGSTTRIVILTAAIDDRQILEAVTLGIDGIVLKEAAPRVLVDAIRKVHGGGQWLEPDLVVRLAQSLTTRKEAPDPRDVLTPRELQIVRMVAEGLRNKEIAERLGITEGTVKIHLHAIYEKLSVDGRLRLTLYAHQHGLA